MAIKAEIGWTRKNEDGTKVDICARRFGREWHFTSQLKRGDDWKPITNPALEDWIELLENVRRRITRRLLAPEEETRVKKMIYDRFPGTKVD